MLKRMPRPGRGLLGAGHGVASTRERSFWSNVGRTAIAKVVVMLIAGVFGLINTRLIIGHFGADAYAQYGLIATFPTLLPFADMGIGAAIVNVVAGSGHLSDDSLARRTITTAIRVLIASSLVIATVGIVLGLLGVWPALLGGKLMDGGGLTATLCLVIYAAALPLSIGQRVVVGMGRAATQVISQGVVSPAMSCLLVLVIIMRVDAGNAVSVLSYGANTLVSIICVVVAWRATTPLLADAIRDVPRLRSAPGVRIFNTAAPQFVQSLALPIAFQTDRLLLSHLGQGDALAQYNLAATLFNLLTQTVTVAGIAMWPQFAKARAQGRIESPFKPAAVFGAGGLVLAVLLAAVMPLAARLLSDGLITIPIALVIAYVLDVGVEAAKQPLGMYMTDPRGLQFQVLPVLILVPLNFALSWYLISPLGPAGPVMGSVVSVFFCQLFPYAWWVARDVRHRRELDAERRRAGASGAEAQTAPAIDGEQGQTDARTDVLPTE